MLLSLPKTLFLAAAVITLSFSTLGFTPRPIDDPQLVGYWPLNNGAGTTANDESGYGHPGTLSGSWSTQAAPVNFNNPGSIALDGANGQGVEMSRVTGAVNNITLSAWVKWSGSNGQDQFIVYNGGAGDGYGIIVQANGNLAIWVGGAGMAESTQRLTAGAWQNVVAIRSNAEWRLYLDGKALALSGNPLPTTPTGQSTIGRASPGTNSVFNGWIDEVRIYTRVLAFREFAWNTFPLYVASYHDHKIVRVDRSGEQSVLTSGDLISNPDGIVVDENGTLYVANYYNHKIIQVDPYSGEQTLLTSGGNISFPDGMVIDDNGMLLVASLFNDRIVKVDRNDGTQTTLAMEGFLDAPSGVAFDRDGMLFVTSYFNNAVVKIDPASGGQSLITAGGFIDGPNALAFDEAGLLYVTNELNHSVVRIDPASGEQVLLTDHGLIDNAYALVFYNGDLYVSSSHNDRIVVVNPSTGAQSLFISDNLLNGPTALAFGPNYDADLRLSVSAPVEPVISGSSLTYTLSVENAGSDPASGVVVSDTLPTSTTFVTAEAASGWAVSAPAVGDTGMVSFSTGQIQPGEVVQHRITVQVSSSLAHGSTILNTAALISAYPVDPLPGNNSASTSTVVNKPTDLSLTVSDQGAAALPGSVVVYTLQYNNTGAYSASGVMLVETIPAHAVFNAGASSPGWTCTPTTCTLTIGTLNSGATGSALFAVTVTHPLAAGVPHLTNVAHIESHPGDQIPENNNASDTTPITAAPDLSLTISDGSSTATPGQTVRYTLAFANTGNQDATGVILFETVPVHAAFSAGASSAGWECVPDSTSGSSCSYVVGPLAGGGSGSVTFAITVEPSAPSGQLLINTAAITGNAGNSAEPNPADNNAADSNTLAAQADLEITQTAPPAVLGNENFTYTLAITNHGPSDAHNVHLTGSLPSGLILVTHTQASGPSFNLTHTGGDISDQIETLASGAAASIQITVRANSAAGNLSPFHNSMMISTSTADPDLANNSATVITEVSVLNTVTELNASQNPSVYGQPVSFSAVVTSQAGSLEGTVTFHANATALPGCEAVPLSGGQAECTNLLLNAGTHSVTATYNGSATHHASTGSLAAGLQIDQADPQLAWNQPANLVYPAALSEAQLNASAAIPGTFTYTPAAGTSLPIGSHTLHVDFTPSDSLNYLSASYEVVITIVDGHAPVITVPGDLVIRASHPVGAVVVFEVKAHDNIDGPLAPSCTHSSGGIFAVGTTTVACSSTDQGGNTAMASFLVTVLQPHFIYLPISIR